MATHTHSKAAASALLAKRQNIANGALVVAGIGLAGQSWLGQQFPAYASTWLPHIKMACEAALVGGLADWFAVTAIFRRPLNLPIPHTAIIPENQERIANTIGHFVQANFLTGSAIRESFAQGNIAYSVASWLEKEEHARKLAHEIGVIAPRVLEFFRHPTVGSFIERNVIEWIRASSTNTMIAQMLQAIFNNGNHQQALQFFLVETDDWLHRHPEQAKELLTPIVNQLLGPILSKVRNTVSGDLQSTFSLLFSGVSLLMKPETRKAAEELRGAVGQMINIEQRIVEGIIQLLHEVRNDPHHIFRRKLDEAAQYYIGVLSVDSPEAQRLNAFKNEMINNPAVVSFFSSVIVSVREAVQKDLNSVKPTILQGVSEALMMLGRNLAQDPQFQADLNKGITDAACFLAEEYADTTIRVISNQVKAWESERMVLEIERAIGPDLQMIRLNGTLVGGLIGLVLSFLS